MTSTIRAVSICLAFSCASILNANAQEKTLSPKNPDVVALSKFLNYPVGHLTGTPQIGIPIYALNAGSLQLNLQMDYHASGLRVGEPSSWVGAGWSLNGIPEITRTINNRDDLYGGYLSNTYVKNYVEGVVPNLSFQYRDGMETGLIDEEPDLFQYVLLNKSGSFMYQKYNDGSFKALPVPYEKIDISFDKPLGLFIITDIDGTIYRFGRSVLDETIYDYNFSSNGAGNGHTAHLVSWKCTEIISPSKKDTIHFKYDPVTQYDVTSKLDRIEIYDNSIWTLGYHNPQRSDNELWGNAIRTYCSSGFNPGEYQRLYPPRITAFFSGLYGRYTKTIWALSNEVPGTTYPNNIVFAECMDSPPTVPNGITLVKNRKIKEIFYRSNRVVFQSSKEGRKLDYIRVYNQNSELVRKATFLPLQYIGNEYDLPYGASFQTTELQLQGNEYSPKENYKFFYHGSPSHSLTHNDAWGYAGVADINSLPPELSYGSSIPTQNVTTANRILRTVGGGIHNNTDQLINFPIGGGQIEPDPNSMRNGTLHTIVYPTGGRTEFSYSTNQYRDLVTNEVKLAGGLRVDEIRFYDGSHDNPVKSKIYKYGENEDGIGVISIKPDINDFVYEQYQQHYRAADPPPGEPTFDQSAHLVVDEVKRTFVNNSLSNYYYCNGAPVNYPYVTEYESDMGLTTGKTVYINSLPNFQSTRDYNSTLLVNPIPWKRGQPLAKIDYTNKNGQFVWVSKQMYGYTNHILPEKIHVGKIFRNVIPIVPPSADDYYTVLETNTQFIYKSYPVEVGKELLSEETQMTRDPNNLSNIITQTTKYYYDNPVHLQPTRIETSNSKGNLITRYQLYPQDYPHTDSYISNLISGHKFNYPVETVTIKEESGGKHVIGAELKEYTQDQMGFLRIKKQLDVQQPIPLSNFKFSNSSVGQLPFSSTAQNFSSDPGYVDVISFDAYDSHGNLTQATSKQSLISGIWGYNNSYPVVQVIGANHTTAASFVDQSILNNPQTTDAGMRLELNKIRTGLIDTKALVTTYTYRPLVGITSQTDPNNRTTYYEYDAFGRLSYIRDKDNRIIKKICYNYQNQPEDCSGVCLTTTEEWQHTGTVVCEVVDGENTGYGLVTQMDMNPCSPTYSNTRQVYMYDPTACPPPVCGFNNCQNQGMQYQCVYGNCEQGIKVYTDSYYDYQNNHFVCIYHYEWSNGTWSADVEEYSGEYCSF